METITLGNNINPPECNIDVTMDVFDCVRTKEFDPVVFNSVLLAIVVYLDTHKVNFNDGQLPWAESIGRTQ